MTRVRGVRRVRLVRGVLVPVLVLVPWFGVATAAAQQEPIRYTLSFDDAVHHYIDVEAAFPAAGGAALDLMMPVWTPGSYLVREYARNVEALSAASADGRPLETARTSKNHWRVRTGGAPEVRVRYRVYSREMGVRTSWVESRFALIAGAGTFITRADAMARPHLVELKLPEAWKTSISGLPGGDRPHTFAAPDYDRLVDSPIVAGNPAVHEFRVAGKPHYLVNVGEPTFWDVDRSVADVRKIVEQNLKLWGELPYSKYVFFNVLTESGGGLEHLNSTVLMTTRWATSTRRRYVAWLGLVSHEFFHAWNVKRLRPIELGPFDYDRENYTRSLWISEGLTDYYGNLLVRRAGLVSDDEYLQALSSDIRQLQTTPGRLVRPVEEASFDAWIKEYRPDENSPNVAISYYTKGAVLGFLIDAKIRRATDGRRSLDDVMREAYKRFAGTRGFTPEDFRRVIGEVAGVDLSQWLRRVLETTEELDYTEALEWFGLQFGAGGARRPGAPAWQGMRLRNSGNRMIVTNVLRGTPAYGSGINVEDEIVALDDYRVRGDQWDSRIETYRPGDTVSVLVARRDELMRFSLTLEEPEPDRWQVSKRSNASPVQQERLSRWISTFTGRSP